MTVAPEQRPFSDQHWNEVQSLLARLDSRQTMWLSGFLAGQSATPTTTAQAPPAASRTIVAYGGETGNSEALAQRMKSLAAERGVQVQVQDLANAKIRQLTKTDQLFVICSTHGDGDPPEPIQTFYDHLMADHAPALKSLSYSVLALGDSSYEHFCSTGRELDTRLEKLGARRLLARQECDVDFEAQAADWIKQSLEQLVAVAAPSAEPAPSTPTAPSTKPSFSKQNPLTVDVIDNICLSAPDRKVPLHHLEIEMETEGFELHPGDAVGVFPENSHELVSAVLTACDLSGESAVVVKETAMPLVQALREHCDLTIPGRRFLELWAQAGGASLLSDMAAADSKVQRKFLKNQQVLDLMRDYPARLDAQVLVDSMRPLQPRLYDIANDPDAGDGELHLLVKRYQYEFASRIEEGVASDYLLQLQPGENLRIYPHHSKRFRLPESPDTPIILIADGTGLAPYRAFIQALAAREKRNPCWLVFSEKTFEDDFLYQTDWQRAHSDGILEHLDTVFYQDTPGRSLSEPLTEQHERFGQWISDREAHVYFCGDKALLTACEQGLQALVTKHNGPDWKQLVRDKRIHRNLY